MTEPLLSARGASVSYPGSPEPALRGADLDVVAGAAIGIVGESGSGKTTLGRALVGAVPLTSGEIRVGGLPWSAVRRGNPVRRSVQMIFQDPYASLNPMLTAHETVAEVCRAWDGLSRSAASRRAGELLHEVGLSGQTISRRPKQLSGGQCQRVGIARALACNPGVLVADEPTSALDASVQAQVLNLLLDLRESRGLALVLISHDLSVVEYLTTQALVMYRGCVVERGSTDMLLNQPRHPYTRALVDSIPGSQRLPQLVRNAVDPAVGCVFAARCPNMQPDCLAIQPPLTGTAGGAHACLHPLGATKAPAPIPHRAVVSSA
jgi:peptide/nickel transport system ATP-binding protein